eukprot:TRINITY_DN1839_c0_g1_i1.p1 TRINITY_DN1839_c0_g1~~TRINITY_DN1839_c0_g1_i1.p1  ORF type:complete len:327 (-),score=99.62 TRINITY_DN1839_c0_g1_i1:117-1064(-)
MVKYFQDGNVIVLRSVASGKSLRIMPDGQVNGHGEQGHLARFIVHKAGKKTIKLQNIQKEHWLRIHEHGRLEGLGKGGEFCAFRIHKHDGWKKGEKIVSLESIKFPGQFVGILPDGHAKPAHDTKQGPHGSYEVIYIGHGHEHHNAPHEHEHHPHPPASAPPSHAPHEIAHGRVVSFRSLNYPDYYIRHKNAEGWADKIDGSDLFNHDSSWRVVPGLADPHGISFEATNYPGYYLRHQNWELFAHKSDGSDLFRKDATFYARPGHAQRDLTSFESSNYPGHFIRHQNGRLRISPDDHTPLFHADATWTVVAPNHH